MTLRRYSGLSPQRVGKDAKYAVTAKGEIRLVYRTSNRERYLLTTEAHHGLAQMVNDIKVQLTNVEGGAFYINEFRDVLVPDGEGGPCLWAGHYEGLLEFIEGPLRVSPQATPGLKPGDEWFGPHVGIPYILMAGGNDIRYEIAEGRRREEVRLSDFFGAGAARTLALRLAQHKGQSGGRIFINECAEFFTRIDTRDSSTYVYLGSLDEDPWFPPPDGYPRP
jgi:hypothetical protein